MFARSFARKLLKPGRKAANTIIATERTLVNVIYKIILPKAEIKVLKSSDADLFISPCYHYCNECIFFYLVEK